MTLLNNILCGFYVFGFIFNFAQATDQEEAVPFIKHHYTFENLRAYDDKMFEAEIGKGTKDEVYLFSKDGHELKYIPVGHGTDLASVYFQAIRSEINSFKPELVVLEGFGSSAKSQKKMEEIIYDLIQEGTFQPKEHQGKFLDGESIYAACLAYYHHIPFTGGEPSSTRIVKGLLKQKAWQKKDVVYFYFVRMFQQLKMEEKFNSLEDLESCFYYLVNSFKTYFGETISVGKFENEYTLVGFCGWLKENNIAQDYETLIAYETVMPFSDGTLLQKISHDIMTIRDTEILTTIFNALNDHKRVLVIYGGAHYFTQSEVLKSYLGSPQPRALP